ncbi:MAG: alpha/beta hydrolase [Deltaproteobacteria bacterium]|nr:alpha/beta hydrolase [Deltaproteobacteria bacterium]
MSLMAKVANAVIRRTVGRRVRRDDDVLALRPMLEAMAHRPPRVSGGVHHERTTIGGVPVERLAPRAGAGSEVVLYLHGGGFVAGAPASHRALSSRLAEGLGATVLAVDYRLAPEHPFPAAPDDVLAVYRAVLEGGAAPAGVAVVGDSAGGHLALGLGIRLVALGEPVPAAIVGLSPVCDAFDAARPEAPGEAILTPGLLRSMGPRYAPELMPDDPRLALVRADLRGLPPVLLHASDAELLHHDAVVMRDALRAAGVEVTLETWPGQFHVWHLGAPWIPEANAAIAALNAFLRDRFAGR